MRTRSFGSLHNTTGNNRDGWTDLAAGGPTAAQGYKVYSHWELRHLCWSDEWICSPNPIAVPEGRRNTRNTVTPTSHLGWTAMRYASLDHSKHMVHLSLILGCCYLVASFIDVTSSKYRVVHFNPSSKNIRSRLKLMNHRFSLYIYIYNLCDI